MVERGWRDGVREARERDQTDQVASTARDAILIRFLFVALDKFCCYVFDCRQAIDMVTVDLKIHRLHTAATVDDHFHRDPFGIDHGLLAAHSRSRQGNDHRDERQQHQHIGKPGEALTPRWPNPCDALR